MSGLPGAVETSSGEVGKMDQAPAGAPVTKERAIVPEADSRSLVKKERLRLSQASTLKRAPAIDHYKESTGLLDPRSKMIRNWDIWTAVLLIWTAIATPYEVGFLNTNLQTQAGLALFIVNWIVDGCFFADLVIQFNLSYFDPEIGSGMWIVERKKIVKHYLSGMFLIDLISILPFGHIGLFLKDPDIEKLKIFRAVRLLRLVKLLRIMKSGKLIKQMEDNIPIDYNILTLCKFIVATLTIAHWLACFWHLTTRLEDAEHNWVKQYFDNHHMHWYSEPGAFEKYIASFYWALVTMSTIGYGDITPVTSAERGFEIFSIFAGTSVFAYVVGSVCTIVANMDKKNNEFYELMDNLNAFMIDTKLPLDLRSKLRAYFRYRRRSAEANTYGGLLMLMSPELRGEVAISQCGSWLQQVPFFDGAPKEFVTEIAQILQSETFPQGEEIIKEGEIGVKMYIVQRGVVAGKGKVYCMGKVFGEDILGGEIASTYTVRALTYSDCYSLAREDLEGILENFEMMKLRLRKAATRKIAKEALATFASHWRLVKSGKETPPMLQTLSDEVSPGKLEMFKRNKLVRKLVMTVSEHTPAGYNKPAFSLMPDILQQKGSGLEMDSSLEERDTIQALSVSQNGLDPSGGGAAGAVDHTGLLRALNTMTESMKTNTADLTSIRSMILSMNSRLDFLEMKAGADGTKP